MSWPFQAAKIDLTNPEVAYGLEDMKEVDTADIIKLAIVDIGKSMLKDGADGKTNAFINAVDFFETLIYKSVDRYTIEGKTYYDLIEAKQKELEAQFHPRDDRGLIENKLSSFKFKLLYRIFDGNQPITERGRV